MAVRMEGDVTDWFKASVLSPLLFIMITAVISREICRDLPWELLYADDLVLMAESEEL